MSDYEVVDGETGELVTYRTTEPVTLFGTSDPVAVIEKATAHAKALADVIRQRHLYKTISGRNHVLVEGWTLLGSMVGVFPVVVWSRRLENPEGWEARVEARTLSGAIVGAAESQCTRLENMWSFKPIGKGGKQLQPRDDFALRSMAQTRATSKALRAPIGFVIQLAGYNATPAEEMPEEETPDGANPKGDDTKAPTEPQQKKLFALIGKLDKAELDPQTYKFKDPDTEHYYADTFDAWSQLVTSERFGADSRAHLTRGQVAWLIDQLEGNTPF